MTGMQDPNIENTVPSKVNGEPEETAPTHVGRDTASLAETIPVAPVPPTEPARKRGARRWPWVLLGILLVIAGLAVGAALGYRSAAQIRSQKQEEARVSIATQHFMSGLVAQQNKQYELAKTQFTYVLELDPSFPGAQDKLREVMIAMAMDKTPTPAPTVVIPTLTPTLDTRPQEEIYNQARQLYANKDWDNFFSTIDALRRIDPSYKAVEIDGMLYFAYRFRGIDKIIYQANLEGGLYDLALAERFAPLDVDALGYRTWARLYINGASFWQIDWVKVMEYFEQIYPYFPNMRDGSGLTAIERYRLAAKGQGDKLSAAGDYCGAIEFYKKSLEAVPDGALSVTATAVYLACYPPTAVPTNTPLIIPTVTQPTVVVGTTVPPQPTEAATDVTPSVEPTKEAQ